MNRDVEISLRSTLGAIAGGASLDDALTSVADNVVGSLGATSGKVWLVKAGDMCSTCPLASECQDRSLCLHLRASTPGATPESPRVPLVVFRDRLAARGGNGRLGDGLAGGLLFHEEATNGLGHSALALAPLKGPTGVLGLVGVVRETPLSSDEFTTFKSLADAALVAIRIADLTSRFQRASMQIEESEEAQVEVTGLLHAILYGSTEYNVIAEDLRGNILLFSEGARNTYGYTPDEVIGKAKADILYAPEEIASGKIVEILNETMRTGRCEAVLSRVKKNGDAFPARATFTVRRDADGDPSGFVVVERDLSSERNSRQLTETAARQVAQVEDHLRDLKTSYSLLENDANDLRAQVDRLQQTLAETRGQANAELSALRSRNEALERDNRALAGEADRARDLEDLVEIRAATIEGLRARLERLAANANRSEAGASDGASQPVAALAARPDPVRAVVGQHVLDDLSHEVRSALSGIAGLATMALEAENDLSDRQLSLLKRIVRNAHALLLLSNNVLDSVRIGLGQFELFLDQIDLREVVGNACSAAEPIAGTRSIVIDALSLGEPIMIATDRLKLRQALVNALTVALEATRKDFVLVSVESSEARTVISVRAEGGTISDGVLCYPGDVDAVSIGTGQSGMGLSLWIARRILDAIGGRLDVELSDDSVVIHLVLSATGPEPATDLVAGDIVSRAVVHSGNSADANLLATILRRDGCEPIVLDNVEQALSLVKVAAVDLVIVDVDVSSGWTLLAELNRGGRRRTTLAVGGSNQRGRALHVGAQAFVPRPISATAIRNGIRAIRDHSVARITVIEDDEDAQVILGAMLDHPAFRATIVGDGGLALASMADHRPDAIVLDICLPDIDGFGILRTLAADGELSKVPVVLVTAKDISQDDRIAASTGVAAILQKGSFGREQLLAEVDKALHP